MYEDRRSDRWVIVLAGGSGTRLSGLTTTGDGDVVPKQYCSLFGGRSLLGDALARAQLLTSLDHVVVVVAREHARWWEREFADSHAHVVVQPRNRGTAAGVLLPLLTVLRTDPGAQVTLLPSDHFVADEGVLARALLAAQGVASAHRPLLLGMAACAAETDYGWILPGPGTGATRAVAAFVEKPGPAAASQLLSGGAVWNSLIITAAGQALLELYRRRLPRLLAAFQWAMPHASPARAEALYQRIADADFSRDLLQGSEPYLDLRVAPPCGWTDLGTPERLRACATGNRLRRALAPSRLRSALDLAAAAAAPHPA